MQGNSQKQNIDVLNKLHWEERLIGDGMNT